jgi:hypothetical protein
LEKARTNNWNSPRKWLSELADEWNPHATDRRLVWH